METFKIIGQRKTYQYIAKSKDGKQYLLTKLCPSFEVSYFLKSRTTYGIPYIFSIFKSQSLTYIKSDLPEGVPLTK